MFEKFFANVFDNGDFFSVINGSFETYERKEMEYQKFFIENLT